MEKILVIDNYDSFVYNLVHLLYEVGVEEVVVAKNNQIGLSEVSSYQHILLSPGPGLPKDAGIMPQIIRNFGAEKNILGVCLGHQAVAEAYGGNLINLKEPLHGVQSTIHLEEDSLFKDIPKHTEVGHYHSWVVDPKLPDDLIRLARDEKGNLMALKHKDYRVKGVQFHPESIMTKEGKKMINNWVKDLFQKEK